MIKPKFSKKPIAPAYVGSAMPHGLQNSRLRRGQALIEMALVVTVLLFLTLGLIQYGLLANAKVTLTNIAREGARYAAVHGREATFDAASNDRSSDPDRKSLRYFLINKVANSTTLRDITDAEITVTPATLAQRTDSEPTITVTVSYNMTKKFILPSGFPGLSSFGTATKVSASMVLEK